MSAKTKFRTLKVYNDFSLNFYPRISLMGKWLKEAGFNVGDKLFIDLVGDKIVITKQPEEVSKMGGQNV